MSNLLVKCSCCNDQISSRQERRHRRFQAPPRIAANYYDQIRDLQPTLQPRLARKRKRLKPRTSSGQSHQQVDSAGQTSTASASRLEAQHQHPNETTAGTEPSSSATGGDLDMANIDMFDNGTNPATVDMPDDDMFTDGSRQLLAALEHVAAHVEGSAITHQHQQQHVCTNSASRDDGQSQEYDSELESNEDGEGEGEDNDEDEDEDWRSSEADFESEDDIVAGQALSAWDQLGEGFEQEASQIGQYEQDCFGLRNVWLIFL